MTSMAEVPSESRTRTPQISRLGIPSTQAVPSKTASVPASQAPILENANAFDLRRSTVFKNNDILRNVLSYVKYDDLLRSRMVNNFWNETVCTNPTPSHGVAKNIWPKLKLQFPKLKTKKKITDEDELDLADFEAFRGSSLIQKFRCPNIRFFRVDLRNEAVQDFFITHGPYIRNLKLDNCVMSLLTFQRIINKCPLLVGFRVYGMFHCISHTESLLSSRDAVTLCSFVNLKQLAIESTYVRRSIYNLGNKDPEKRHRVPVQQIHPLVIHELLNSTAQLEWLKIKGFGFSTVITIMQTLVTNPLHTKLANLEFYDISDGMDVEGFREWAKQLSHMKLQNFALTFLVGSLSRAVGEAGNLDQGVQELIVHHGETLVELNLTHCHVTNKIFNAATNTIRMSNLKTLILKGTKIYKISRSTKEIMENLTPEAIIIGKEDDAVRAENYFLRRIAASSHMQNLQAITAENQEFGFKIFTPFDKACFVVMGITALVGLGQLLVGAFGETGKFLYILAAGGILTCVQRMRET